MSGEDPSSWFKDGLLPVSAYGCVAGRQRESQLPPSCLIRASHRVSTLKFRVGDTFSP